MTTYQLLLLEREKKKSQAAQCKGRQSRQHSPLVTLTLKYFTMHVHIEKKPYMLRVDI